MDARLQAYLGFSQILTIDQREVLPLCFYRKPSHSSLQPVKNMPTYSNL